MKLRTSQVMDFPQIGDEVIYFMQGHQQYVEAVKSSGVFE